MATPRALLKSPIMTLNCLHKSHSFYRTNASSYKYNHEKNSPQLVSVEYADLNLADKFCEEVGHVRVRQHVNPLRAQLMIPAQVPDWNNVFTDATLPLMVDIGSGSGRFLLWLAKTNPHCRNYLGIEIREKVWKDFLNVLEEPLKQNHINMFLSLYREYRKTLMLSNNVQLVKRANYWVDELAISNIHFIFANAMVTFKQLVTTYPGPLKLVTIMCPDPHFKKRHHKRRVVQKPLVDSIVDCLMPGGQVFIQSDIFDVALDMRSYFDAEEERLVHIDSVDSTMHCNNEGWLLNSPLGIRTEREIYAENEGAQIYRRMYQKVAES